MKTLLFLLAIWGLLGLVQCKKDADVGASLDQQIELRAKQTTTVAVANTKVQLTLTKLADSRCPTDLTCVWAGIAQADVTLRDGAGAVQNVVLYLGTNRRPDSAAVVLDAAPYWLFLTAVTPYPSRTSPRPGTQTATLRLSRQ